MVLVKLLFVIFVLVSFTIIFFLLKEEILEERKRKRDG